MGDRPKSSLRNLGPGLITGAADDDPSSIATYSQAGAHFGFSMLWTVVFTLPLMVAIQLVSTRIGYVTQHGLAANIKTNLPRWVLLLVVGMLLRANLIGQKLCWLGWIATGVMAITVMTMLITV